LLEGRGMPKILIVDDEDVFIKMIQKLLVGSGYEVVTAGDGQEGLEKAKSENPDLIILDVMMPIMDGFTMLKEVREDEKVKDTPVIMCTSKSQKDYIEESQELKVDAYITKPIDSPVFLAKVVELLKKS